MNVPWDMLPWDDSFARGPSNGSDCGDFEQTQASANLSQAPTSPSDIGDSWRDKSVETSFMDAATFQIRFGKTPRRTCVANSELRDELC